MKQRILVVDGSSAVRLAVADALEMSGFEVASCAGARDVDEAIRMRPHDLAIIGDTLSDGPGIEYIRSLRSRSATMSLPSILLSATGEIEERIKALNDGPTDFVQRRDDLAYLLKRTQQLVSPTIAALPSGTPVSGPFRVLVVDDSPTYLHVIDQELGQWGHDVVGALSGQTALRYLQAQRADCVILDVFMPGLSGVDTCRMIRANPALADVPIVMLTGHEDSIAKLSGTRMGADAYLVKSAGFKSLDSRISELLLRRFALGKVRPGGTALPSIAREAAKADGANANALRIKRQQGRTREQADGPGTAQSRK